jgi:hypothetical protein
MDQRLTAILLRNDLELAQAFFERLSRAENPDDYRMLTSIERDHELAGDKATASNPLCRP